MFCCGDEEVWERRERLWKVCVARPENVGTHGCTRGERVDMSPQEAQARNERELGVTVTAFSSAKRKAR